MHTGQYQAPDPETHLADHPSGAKMYSTLAKVPLYVHVRIIYPNGAPFTARGRRSFHLSWIIDAHRWSTGTADARILPADVVAWAKPLLTEAYPSVAEVTGFSPAEIAELIAEQKVKRAKYEQKA